MGKRTALEAIGLILGLIKTGIGSVMVGSGYRSDDAMTVALGAALLAAGGIMWVTCRSTKEGSDV